jgi:hypothetical protein
MLQAAVEIPQLNSMMDALRVCIRFTVVESLLTFSFQENRLAQLASIDQQREIMRYMRALNEWLDRDVRDRQSELRGVSARVDQLREDLGRMATGGQSRGMPP